MTKVLIVEDSIVTQKLIMLNLEKRDNLEVIGFATNGIEAIMKTIELSPDVIVMDVCMPKMNGLDALKEIKRLNNVPVIFLSTQVYMQDELLNSGAVCFLEKNYENIKINLVDKINQYSKKMLVS
jgi:two-component system chemotaxis response regulator CheB